MKETSITSTGVQPRPRKHRTRPEGSTWDPKQAIFETAERLCAERGIEAVSVRDIAAEAGVSLAALNYYFGSRTNLLAEILRTRTDELRVERNAKLEAISQQENPALRDILRALMSPLAQWRAPNSPRRSSLQFVCRALLAADPALKSVIDNGIHEFHNLRPLFRRALPGMSDVEIHWRFHFTMAIEHMNHWDADRLRLSSNGLCTADDPEEALERALDYATAGFMAPVRPK